jgi:hypothetical protein
MRWIIYLTWLPAAVKKFRTWPLSLVPLCAGDGESTGTGAARADGTHPPDLNHVRTRRDLARIINEAVDPLLVKQEILEEQQQEPMEYDNEENFLEVIGPDVSMEEDEALLDEEEEEDHEGEDEDEEDGHDAADGEGRVEVYAGVEEDRNNQLQGEESSREVIMAAAEGPAESAEPAAVAADPPGAATAVLLRRGVARMIMEVMKTFWTTWRRKTTWCSQRRSRTSWTAG